MNKLYALCLIFTVLLTGCASNSDSDLLKTKSESEYSNENVQTEEANIEADKQFTFHTAETNDHSNNAALEADEIRRIIKSRVENTAEVIAIIKGSSVPKTDANGEQIWLEDDPEYLAIESSYSLDEIYEILSDNLAGDMYNSCIGSADYYLKENNGQLYIRASNTISKVIDIYYDTLEIVSYTSDNITVKMEGFDTGYEQMVRVTAAIMLENGAWKLSELSYTNL